MYKIMLNEYAQNAAIPPPVYAFVTENGLRFKAFVILNNVQYKSPPGFMTRESAENAAAKAALDKLPQQTIGTRVTPSAVHESRNWKSPLNEYAQRNRLPLPVYQSQRTGQDHTPTFTSSVEISRLKYSGGSAKTKKKAENEAARMAVLAIQSVQPSFFPAPEPSINTAPQSQVGLPTDISTNLHNVLGKKRGRGDNVNAISTDDGRLKTGPPASQAAPAPEVLPHSPMNAIPQPTKSSVEEKMLQRQSTKELAMETLVMCSESKETAPDINTLHIPGAQKVSDEHAFEATSKKFKDGSVKKLLHRELLSSTTNDDEATAHSYRGALQGAGLISPTLKEKEDQEYPTKK